MFSIERIYISKINKKHSSPLGNMKPYLYLINIHTVIYICVCLFVSSRGQPHWFLFRNQQLCYSRQNKLFSIKRILLEMFPFILLNRRFGGFSIPLQGSIGQWKKHVTIFLLEHLLYLCLKIYFFCNAIFEDSTNEHFKRGDKKQHGYILLSLNLWTLKKEDDPPKRHFKISNKFSFNWKVFILPRLAELLIHKEKQGGCLLLNENKHNILIWYIKYIICRAGHC